MTFYTGQQVVCIDDKVQLAGGTTIKDAAITEGEVYTVRWIGMHSNYVFAEYLGLRLVGVDSKFGEPWGDKDCPFAARRFRPVVNDPIALLRRLAIDPDFRIDAPEGPTRGAPDDGQRTKEKELEKAE